MHARSKPPSRSFWLIAACICACSSDADHQQGKAEPPDAQTDSNVPDATTPSKPQHPMHGKDAGTSGASGSPSSPGSTSPPPSIDALTPSTASLGQEVVVTGQHLLPEPRVSIADRTILPARFDDTTIRFQIPVDLTLSSCQLTSHVVVTNDAGTSSPLAIVLEQPIPQLVNTSGLSVHAGSPLTFRGSHLTGSRFELRGEVLSSQQQSDTRATVAIPRTAAIGKSAIVAKNDCGSDELPIEVLKPLPRIQATDLPTIAVDGVLYVTSDVSTRTGVSSFEVGGKSIAATDAAHFTWIDDDSADGSTTFAVRIPAGVGTGRQQITIIGPDGESDPYAIDVVGASANLPGPPDRIALLPNSAKDDGTFPISTTAPFPRVDMSGGTESYLWSYDLHFESDQLPSADGGASVCTGHGRITGIERHCPDDGCGHTNGCPSNADTCNDLAGTYHIDEDENRVAVLIDRGDPEGAENYVGGWVGEDGVSQAGAAADSSTTSTYLVLRSQRTGIQIAIRHLVHDACNF